MYNFKETEQKILNFWRENQIFAKSLESRKNGKRFVFFEGPPTANGQPGIHHVLARAFKDLYCRYKTMRGFYVLRKAGWDTHGLPVEIQIEKELGFKNKKEIEEYGIEKFNKKAKESVWKYKREWEELTAKMAFWVDLKRPYVTYETSYIESVWNIIKETNKNRLLYKAHKVIPFCTRCGTPLSSHEVAQGYKTVTDKSVYIKFKIKPGQKIGNIKADDGTYILAWTTTPWTLPGNVALAVGKDIDYLALKTGHEYFIVAKNLKNSVFKDWKEDFPAAEEFKGSDLVGLSYEPLFKIKELQSETSHKIYAADFVSTQDGTGVVHTAVMYGEDDYNLGTQLNLPKFHTVNEQGKFQNVSKELDGKFVKSEDVEGKIIEHLQKNNNLLKIEDFEHEYPYCWRCSSPLLYYAKDSWFIRMSALRDQLMKSNANINWIPDHMKEGRFGQWLKEVKDWAISRERYWGTPLPIWECEKCDDFRVVGSYDELKRFSVGRKNKYFLVRHSLSTRNEHSGSITISSDPEKDVYGLTEEGKKLVAPLAEYLSHEHVHVIYSSPFKRTKETAEIIGKALHVNIHTDDRLSEIRHSQVCENRSHLNCPIQKNGRDDMDTKHDGSESWNELRLRLMDLISDLEDKYKGKTIIIVSHADPILLLRYMSQGLSGNQILAIEEKKERPYPSIAGIEKMEWLPIPRNELGELDPHRPFIDEIVFKCPKCRATMKKIPDLLDVWFDSGSMPYAQWHWPFENKDIFKKQFPADFITEAIDQTRGWFYTLLAIATIMGKGTPYKNVISLGHILDEKGQKMSKSKGNVVLPADVFEKAGVDATRWHFYTVNAPGEYKNFTVKDVEDKLHSLLYTLQNCLRFYDLYKNQPQGAVVAKNDLDVWIMSKLHRLIGEVTRQLDSYDAFGAARGIEKFIIEDFSNWWLRRSRKRSEALPVLKLVLTETSKLIAPFMPYIAEDIFKNLESGNQEALSVHLAQWPANSRRFIKDELEAEMNEARNLVTRGLALRKEKSIKVRQPLKAIIIKRPKKFRKDIEQLIKDELNIKKIAYDGQTGEPKLDEELDQALIFEGYARELIRQIQDMRKEAGYRVDEKAKVQWSSGDGDLGAAIEKWADLIKQETSLDSFSRQPKTGHVFDLEKESQIDSGKNIWLGLKK